MTSWLQYVVMSTWRLRTMSCFVFFDSSCLSNVEQIVVLSHSRTIHECWEWEGHDKAEFFFFRNCISLMLGNTISQETQEEVSLDVTPTLTHRWTCWVLLKVEIPLSCKILHKLLSAWSVCAAWCEESMFQKSEHRMQSVVFHYKLPEFHVIGLPMKSKACESASIYLFQKKKKFITISLCCTRAGTCKSWSRFSSTQDHKWIKWPVINTPLYF